MKFTKILKALDISVIAYASVLISLIIIAALMMRPIADDFGYFTDPLIHSPLKFTFNYYMNWTARSGQVFLMSNLFDIFGKRVVTYGVILLTGLLAASITSFVYAVLYKKRASHQKLIALALVITAVCLFATPSVFDSNLWITSSTVYVGSMIAMFVAIAAAIFSVKANLTKKRYYILLLIITFIAQLFSEPTSLMMIYIGVVSLLITAYVTKNRHAVRISITFLAASILGFLYMYFAPSTVVRRVVLGEIHPSLPDVFLQSFGDLSKMSYIFTSYRIVMVVILGLFIALVLNKISKKTTIVITLLSLVSAIILSYLLFFVMRYTLGAWAPDRAFTVISAIFCVLLSTAIGAIASYWRFKKPSLSNVYLPILLFILLPVSLMVTIHDTIPTIHAVSIRADMYDAREAFIAKQLAQKNTTIHFEPLPILLSNSDSVEYHFDSGTAPWFDQTFRNYYGIPNSTKITLDPQPKGYCSLTSNPGWLSAKDCLQIQE